MNNGYFYDATVHNDTIIFVSDDDLWEVKTAGGAAQRLTANLGRVSFPKISPDGELIAFLGRESGVADLYLMPVCGGEATRLTFLGIDRVLGWKDKKTVVIASSHKAANRGMGLLYEINIEKPEPKVIPVGPANRISWGEKGMVVIGRNCRDACYWKRYRGGTAGKLWVKENTKAKFKQILKKIQHALTDPTWFNGRIYFISDHEGTANIYSVLQSGTGLKRHTHHDDFYVRGLNTDGEKIIYTAGADIYTFFPQKNIIEKIDITVKTSAVQAKTRFESASEYLEDYDLINDGSNIAFTSRGRLFMMPSWKGAPYVLGNQDEVRYKLTRWLNDEKHFVAAHTNEMGADELVIVDSEKRTVKKIAPKVSWGKIWSIVPNPENDSIVVTNNRNEAWLVGTKRNHAQMIAREKFGRIITPSWSPDGKWLVYSAATLCEHQYYIQIYNTKTGRGRKLFTPVNMDINPVFDPEGKYLYFLSVREFVPNYNETHFDLGFPFAIRPYVVSLKKEYPNPFETNLDLEVDKEDEDKKENDKGKKNGKKNELDVEIDFDGIENRVLPFPVDFGGISSLSATDGKIFYLREDIAPNINKNHNGNGTDYDLCQFSFEENKEEIFHKDVTGYRLCHDSKKMLIADDDRLRLVYTESKPKTDADGTNKKDGWIDVGRAKLRINPVLEWKQMYREAWLLQKEHFWTKDMSKVEWKDVYNKYLPLLDRVKTRFEMSELLWEMQGELGTSHCYEVFGDYHRRPPHNPLARLGADLKWNEKEKAYEIKIIHQGDSWIKGDDSPMRSFGVDLSEGDMIFEADGVAFNNSNCIHRILENKGGDKVNLLIRKKGKRKKHYTCIPTLKSETGLLYRQWVEKNKDYVHKKSKGKLGYVHIPNMGANGYAEFYRHYIAECRYNGLVVDVRYNGGGHVSQHILKILAQKIVGFDQARWDGILPYPAYAINGPIVAVTNEEAGSDGDIFSHCFKLMKLGKLIGKRTWGGVVGINGQYMLKDGTLTTQPEFSFWFKDVGWKVENYGTDPDIEVEFTPEEWVKGVDPQLDRAIAETMKDMKKNPPLMPDLGKNRPVLKIPKLPKKK